MKHVKLVVLLMVFGLFSLSVHAQYTGPGAKMEYLTVKEVTDNASKLDKQDKQVKLKGFVSEQINKDTFWFKDETGKVRIEIEKKQMPSVPFNEKSEIFIIGEVDYDLLEGVEIEVDSLIVKG